MFLEELPLHYLGYRDSTAGHPGHDLAKSSCMILWPCLPFDTFNAVQVQILAQSRQGPFVERAGEIVRSVGNQPATSCNEKGEVLARGSFFTRVAGCPCKS